MIYLLKTNKECNSNCFYCEYLSRKINQRKSLAVIKDEVIKAKKRGYDTIRLACNSDIRKDLVDILELIKFEGMKIIFETNGRIFYYEEMVNKIKYFIDIWEVYYDYVGQDVNKYIKRRQVQKVIGIKNILAAAKKNKVVIKIVEAGQSIDDYKILIEQIKDLGAKKIKIVIPFKKETNDSIPFLQMCVPKVTQIKKFIKQKKLHLVNNNLIEYNPYLSSSQSLFDTEKAILKIDNQKYKTRSDISVVIPTYNKGKYLRLVLKSFYAQKFSKSKYEIIVVDDGSTDNTESIIKKLKPICNFKYIYWPRTEIKRGEQYRKWAKFHNRAGLTRNIGVKYAQGDIILFNDNDIVVKPDCIKKHDEYHKKHPNIVVTGFRYFVPEGVKLDTRILKNLTKIEKLSISEKTEYGQKLHCRMYDLNKWGWNRIITYNLSLRRGYFEKAGLFHMDSPFWGFEDIDLGVRLSKLNMKFMWDNSIHAYHLPHPSQTGDQNTLAVLWINLNILYRKYLDEEIYNFYRDIILNKLDNLVNDKLC